MIFIVLIAIITYSLMHQENADPVLASKPHTASIKVFGEITHNDPASRENIRAALKKAFEHDHVKAIVLRINSPGGSPVQSRQIYDDIRYFKEKYPDIKIYAAIEDMGTSAAYLIAAATDAIYADKTSLVGSIGVKIDSFGAVEGIHKLGIERRLYTAGKYKAILDPFSPQNAEETAFIESQLKSVHQAFIENVKAGRGKRLSKSPDLFTGLFWCGEQALPLGLIDGFGDVHYIARELAKAPEVIDYTHSSGLWDRLSDKVGSQVAIKLKEMLFRFVF
jgi:protease-4